MTVNVVFKGGCWTTIECEGVYTIETNDGRLHSVEFKGVENGRIFYINPADVVCIQEDTEEE